MPRLGSLLNLGSCVIFQKQNTTNNNRFISTSVCLQQFLQMILTGENWGPKWNFESKAFTTWCIHISDLQYKLLSQFTYSLWGLGSDSITIPMGWVFGASVCLFSSALLSFCYVIMFSVSNSLFSKSTVQSSPAVLFSHWVNGRMRIPKCFEWASLNEVIGTSVGRYNGLVFAPILLVMQNIEYIFLNDPPRHTIKPWKRKKL